MFGNKKKLPEREPKEMKISNKKLVIQDEKGKKGFAASRKNESGKKQK